jgi:hypothetical protein
MTTGRFVMSLADENNNPLDTQHFPVVLGKLQGFIRNHPSPEVDLCALPLGSIINHCKTSGIRIFYRSIPEELMPTSEQLNELTALEDILMIGYPNGIWDTVNNMPILRKGVTATHPCLDYNGKKEIMIDAACFPGSSGSPVLIYNPSGYLTKSGKSMLGSQRTILIGILYGGPQHTATGQIVIAPSLQQPISVSKIPNNLGAVIKAERILELRSQFQPFNN